MVKTNSQIESSYVIFKEGSYCKAKNCLTGQIDFYAEDAATVIQSAINAIPSTGGKVFIKSGVYEVKRLVGKTNVVLEGEVVGQPWDLTQGTVLKFVGNSGDPVLDFRNVPYWFGVKDLKIDGNNKLAGYGIRMGTELEGRKPKRLLLEGIYIENCDVGIQFYEPGWAGKTDDSELRRFKIRNCNTGITRIFTDVNFVYGAIGLCRVGVVIHSPGKAKFDHVVWSNNTVDVQYADDGWVNSVMFETCWFENSQTAILNRPALQAGVSKDCADIMFIDCHIHTFSTSVLLDFTNIVANIHIIGGNVSPKAKSLLIKFDPDTAGSRIEVRGVDHSHLLKFSGLRTGLISTILYLIRGPPYVAGYSGTDWGNVDNSDMLFNVQPSQIVKAEAVYCWNPRTRSGGLRIMDDTKGVSFGEVVPGVSGWRTDVVDVTDVVRGFDLNDHMTVQAKGDGATPPNIATAYLTLWC
jgi:hypothetical protein